MKKKKSIPRRVPVGLGLIALGILLALLPFHVGMTGLVCAGYGFLCLVDWLAERRGWRRGWHRAIVALGVAVGLILAAGTTYVVLQGRSQWDQTGQSDYAVVLGAQTHGGQPSRTLRERLDLALELMEQNPEMTVIVSGGQGSDEDYTEASVMAAYLERKGADMDRVWLEDRAHNTRQNLRYSAAIARELGLDSTRPVLITSEYHLCRAKYIASTLGMEPVGIGSRTTPGVLMLNYALREVFAFVKAVWQAR